MNITGGEVFFSTCGAGNKYKWQLWPASTSTAGPDMSGTVLAESAEILGAQERQSGTFTAAYAASKGDVLVLVLAVTARANSWTAKMGGWANDNFMPAAIYSYDNGSSWYSANYDAWPGLTATTNKDYDLGGIAHDNPNSYYPNNTSNYKIVNKVTLPEETNGIDFHVSGFYYCGFLSNSYAAAEFRVGVWDAAGDAVVPVKTYDYPTGFGAQPQYAHGCELLFSSPVKMTSGNAYYVGFQFVEATGTVTVMDLAGDNAMKAWPGGAWMVAYKDEGSGWTATNGDAGQAGRIAMNLILTDVHGAVQGTSVHGRIGDAGEVAPPRVNNPLKSGYKVNANRTIQRDNTQYGWDPYAGGK